jgi:hypothetical protein
MEHFFSHLAESGFPRLRSALCIGGMPVKDQADALKRFFLDKR